MLPARGGCDAVPCRSRSCRVRLRRLRSADVRGIARVSDCYRRGGRVYANGQLLPEQYLDSRTKTYSRQLRDQVITIGENSYFVMGDNRLESDDSRFFGDIDRHDLIGIISR